ncbi:DUF4876 domain-containing protein [Prolixibacteraceae bacterium]|nr:DUF4876 domain-containing protein [Prolixibacteraceae bacterium]
MKYKNHFSIFFLVSLLLISCTKNQTLSLTDVEVKIQTPASFPSDNVVMKSGTVTMRNTDTGVLKVRDIQNLGVPFLKVEDGIYDVQLDGIVEIVITNLDNTEEIKDLGVRGVQKQVPVRGGKLTLDVDLYVYESGSDLIFSEIFFTGSLNESGTVYNEDKFFEIYNNSERDLYADGLCIAETEFQSDEELTNLIVDERDKYTAVSRVYRIPGNGTRFLLKPGQSFLVVDRPIDHKTNNPNSFNLTEANIEWFDFNTSDIDHSDVTNMIKLISTPSDRWILNDQGQKSYILFRSDVLTPDLFMMQTAYSYTFTENGEQVNRNAWHVQNSIVLDAVECAPYQQYKWKVISPQLDANHFSLSMSDSSRYGYSIKRKVAFVDNGRSYLIDSDNSSTDFWESANPSPGVIEEN